MAADKGILKYLGLKNLIEHAKTLVDTRVKLIKVEIKEELAKVLSNALIGILLLNFLFFTLLLFSIGLSMHIGYRYGSPLYGFGITAGFYAVLSVVLFLAKDKLGLKRRLEEELNKILNIEREDE